MVFKYVQILTFTHSYPLSEHILCVFQSSVWTELIQLLLYSMIALIVQYSMSSVHTL